MTDDKTKQKIKDMLREIDEAGEENMAYRAFHTFRGQKYGVTINIYRTPSSPPRIQLQLIMLDNGGQWCSFNDFVASFNPCGIEELQAQLQHAADWLQMYCELDTEEGRWWFKQPEYKQGEARWIKDFSVSEWAPAIYMDGYFYFHDRLCHDLCREPDGLFRIGDRIDPPKED